MRQGGYHGHIDQLVIDIAAFVYHTAVPLHAFHPLRAVQAEEDKFTAEDRADGQFAM